MQNILYYFSLDRFICRKFLLISMCKDYLTLNFDEISTILSNDKLLIDNEEQVFEAAMRWLCHDSSRSKYSAQFVFFLLFLNKFCDE